MWKSHKFKCQYWQSVLRTQPHPHSHIVSGCFSWWTETGNTSGRDSWLPPAAAAGDGRWHSEGRSCHQCPVPGEVMFSQRLGIQVEWGVRETRVHFFFPGKQQHSFTTAVPSPLTLAAGQLEATNLVPRAWWPVTSGECGWTASFCLVSLPIPCQKQPVSPCTVHWDPWAKGGGDVNLQVFMEIDQGNRALKTMKV